MGIEEIEKGVAPSTPQVAILCDEKTGVFENSEQGEDAVIYLNASAFKRAFPERAIALLVTLVIEIPVAIIVVSGSDLCSLVGPERYALLMAFLPVTSAISGNVGLQCSSLTTRAVSHAQITPRNWWPWFRTELLVAFFLGFAVFFVQLGVLLAWTKIDFGGVDVGIALTVATAQFLSIFVAGFTGSVAPLIFKFVFKRDAGKWAGPLETAVQDIVGSFAMTYIATWMMEAFVRWGWSPGQEQGFTC